MKWHTAESRADNEQAWQALLLNLKIKALRAFTANQSIATAEKRGACNLARVLEQATYRTTLARLLNFDREFVQLNKDLKENNEVQDWPRHLKMQIIATQTSKRTTASKVFKALRHSRQEKKDHLARMSASIEAFLLRRSLQSIERIPIIIDRLVSSFQKRQLC